MTNEENQTTQHRGGLWTQGKRQLTISGFFLNTYLLKRGTQLTAKFNLILTVYKIKLFDVYTHYTASKFL